MFCVSKHRILFPIMIFKGGPLGGHKVCAKTGNFGLGVRVDRPKNQKTYKKARESTFQITIWNLSKFQHPTPSRNIVRAFVLVKKNHVFFSLSRPRGGSPLSVLIYAFSESSWKQFWEFEQINIHKISWSSPTRQKNYAAVLCFDDRPPVIFFIFSGVLSPSDGGCWVKVGFFRGDAEKEEFGTIS